MSFYVEWILPPLIDLSMRNKRLRPYRERTAGAAEGRVLDIGIGSGLNLPFYPRKAREIFGLGSFILNLPLPSRHSITSSARASTLAGTSRPSALAVLRLSTVSYLVGACTGSSPGFSPLRMRST